MQHAIFEIDLPAGWKQRPLWHNHTSIPPQEISPGHFRWELTGISAIDIDDVPLAPAEIALAGRMVVHYGANSIAEGGQLWTTIGEWYDGLGAPQTNATSEIAAKAHELTGNESDFTARRENC